MIPTAFSRSNEATASSRLLTLIAFVVVIVGLYFGREVLIPLALALVLTFLFGPVVDLLQKCHFHRVPAVLTVLLLGIALVGFTGWTLTGQLLNIIDQIPSYRSNIHEKIQSIRLPKGSRLQNATKTVNELSAELAAASQAADKKTQSKNHPIPVQVAQPPSTAPEYLRAIVGPLTGVLETAAMVIVFTLFMLVKREDLRNRLIRLAGENRLTTVTQALDDASRRLSRYLLLQSLVDTTFGALIGIGVFFVGVPHALLWGVLAGLLRFVPYVGTPIAGIFPIVMSLAVFPGWHHAAIVFGIFVVLEILVANFIEPMLYGANTGISSLAILVAAVFWAILWGPVGLILSTPLTVCLILMGRYVPQLAFLEVLLGDEAVLPVEAHFYQRLLALDEDEATEIANTYLKGKSIADFYDSVLIPALSLSEQDRHLNSLEARTATFVTQSTRELIEDIGERPADQPVLEEHDDENEGESKPVPPDHDALKGLRVLCIPAADEADELVALMAEQLLKRIGAEVFQVSLEKRANVAHELVDFSPQVAIVSALPPFSAAHARSVCRLLRRVQPQLRVLLGMWNFAGGVDKAQERVGPDCGNKVVTSLQQALADLVETERAHRPSEQNEPQPLTMSKSQLS